MPRLPYHGHGVDSGCNTLAFLLHPLVTVHAKEAGIYCRLLFLGVGVREPFAFNHIKHFAYLSYLLACLLTTSTYHHSYTAFFILQIVLNIYTTLYFR